jgi:hypothetical protein
MPPTTPSKPADPKKIAQPAACDGATHVQLVRNVRDRFGYGETFTREEAEEHGILEHCRPFEGQADRAMKKKSVKTN